MTEKSPDRLTTIVELYAFLGYHSEYPPREIKHLRSAVDIFFHEYKASGNMFLHNRSDSGPSTLCARSFLEAENRGQVFFNPEADGPSWPEDRARIISLLTLVFRRKEMASRNNENSARRNRKADASRASPCHKDLKPEKVVPGNLGTAGMLALDPPYSLKTWGKDPKRLDPKSAREYLQDLVFQHEAEVGVDFTEAWLAMAYAEWPESADPVLHQYMHRKNFYLPELEELPDIPKHLLDRLTKDIGIRTLWDSHDQQFQQELASFEAEQPPSKRRRTSSRPGWQEVSEDLDQESEADARLEEKSRTVLQSIETPLYTYDSPEIQETPSVDGGNNRSASPGTSIVVDVTGAALRANRPSSPENDARLLQDITTSELTTSPPTWCCDKCRISKLRCWCPERALRSVSPQCLETTETEFPSSVQSKRLEGDTGHRLSHAPYSYAAQWPQKQFKSLGEPCSTNREHLESLADPQKYKSYAPTTFSKGLVTASFLNSSSQSQVSSKRRLSLSINYPTTFKGYPTSEYQLHFQGKQQFFRTSRKQPESNDLRDPQRSWAMSPSFTEIPKLQDCPVVMEPTRSIENSALTVSPATKSRVGVHQRDLVYDHTLEADGRLLPPSCLSTPTSTEMARMVSTPLERPQPAEPPYESPYTLTRSPTSLFKEPGESKQPPVAQNHHSTDTTISPAICSQADAPEKKVELFFEKPDGAIDLNNPLSAEKLWTLSLSEFFDSYSSHSRISPLTFHALAFTTAFGHHQRLLIRRDALPGAWNKLRNRIRTFLELEKRKKPDETEFEIWVGKADSG